MVDDDALRSGLANFLFFGLQLGSGAKLHSLTHNT